MEEQNSGDFPKSFRKWVAFELSSSPAPGMVGAATVHSASP